MAGWNVDLFEDVFPIENRDFPASYVSLPETQGVELLAQGVAGYPSVVEVKSDEFNECTWVLDFDISTKQASKQSIIYSPPQRVTMTESF